MLDGRPLILVLAAATLAGTSPQGHPQRAPANEGCVAPQTAPTTADAPADGDEDRKKDKKQAIPSNSLTGVWHRGGGEPGKVRPVASSLPRPIWSWPALSRDAVHAGHVETATLPPRSPLPRSVQPHAPPAAA